MDIFLCDCSHQGKLIRLCIDENCKLSRKICENCLKDHNGHTFIQFTNPQSYDVYKINSANPNKQQIKKILQKSLQQSKKVSISLKKTKQKLLSSLEEMVKQVNTIFDEKICGPLVTLINTTGIQQVDMKRAKTVGLQTKKEQLQAIAEQLRVLDRNYFQKVEWYQKMNDFIIQKLKEWRQMIQIHFQQAKVGIQMISFISPFASDLQMDICKIKIAKTGRQSLENQRYRQVLVQKREEERAIFIKKLGRNVIGWDTTISIDNWNKRLEDIKDLSLVNLNLQFVPQQLSLFTNLKNLDLRKNKIRRIQNLKNLAKLQILCLTMNKIQKIEGINTLANLQRLYIAENRIQKIEGLENQTKLQKLVLTNNKIQKIEGLTSLQNLKQLYLNSNQIIKLENLEHLINLTLIEIRNNQIQKNDDNTQMIKKIQKNRTLINL